MKTESPTEREAFHADEKHFPKYTLKVDPQCRRLDEQQKTTSKQQFTSIAKSFPSRNTLRSCSLVGIRGDGDFMSRTTSGRLEDLQYSRLTRLDWTTIFLLREFLETSKL
jgi:hypothetical protein